MRGEQSELISIVTWNINSVKSKLTNANVQARLSVSDIIMLNEIKTDLPFNLPGYVTYVSRGAQGAHRGGCAILLRNQLNDRLSFMDCSVPDQIKFGLRPYTNVIFISAYIPPKSSPYFSMDSVSHLNSTICEAIRENRSLVLLGDMNCRFANLRSAFRENMSDNSTSYAPTQDPVTTPNSNASCLIGMLKPLILVNGLQGPDFQYTCALTYRMKDRWVSELDHCLVSPDLVKSISGFDIDPDTRLPSNHAPVRVTFNADLWRKGTDYSELASRASQLGDHRTNAQLNPDSQLNAQQNPDFSRRQLKWQRTDSQQFTAYLEATAPPTIDPVNWDINDVCVETDSVMRSALEQSRVRGTPKPDHVTSGRPLSEGPSWTRLAAANDSRNLWQTINWNGTITEDLTSKESPTDEQFKTHFENLLSPGDVEPMDVPLPTQCPYVPITDDPITPMEVFDCIVKMKPDKSGGPSGIPPGALRGLPNSWIIFLSVLFNVIFARAITPVMWSLSRLIVIFKKGARLDCGNYRGISIMDSFAKLYDQVLCARLEKWFSPSREQAGARKGRGCLEQILSLRLLIDYAKSKRKKLFITYVDFSKAYDKVPRNALIRTLCRLGCGYMMVAAIRSMYWDTSMILGAAIITTTVGVRQGSPSSCLLFTLYIDEFVKDLHRLIPDDGYLKWLHCLLLMDDTIILATSRTMAIQKTQVLVDFCTRSGMVMNDKKTKFMVINGDHEDRRDMEFAQDELSIQNCESYTYLGAIFTQDGSCTTSVRQQMVSKQPQVLKFAAFVSKNCDFPFWVKLKVMDAALLTSVLYGCEAWICNSATAATTCYRSIVKTLLGVRQTTPNDLVLVELGLPSLATKVATVQKRLVNGLLNARRGLRDDPFMYVWDLCSTENTKGFRYLAQILNSPTDPVTEDLADRVSRLQGSTGSKYVAYRAGNPDFTVHQLYQTNSTVPEYQRVACTRLRLGAHYLAIETGRWSRTPQDSRLCTCGEVQTEQHVVCSCPRTETIREKYQTIDFTDLSSFYSSERHVMAACSESILRVSESR